jgi:hypothetical protein
MWMVAILLFASACKNKTSENTKLKLPLPLVSIDNPIRKDKIIYTEFRAISQYLQTVNFRARTAGIITAVFTRPGDKIKKRQALFVIKPLELSVLENTGSFTHALMNSLDTVFSNQSAFTNQVMVQEGDYVQPGSLLASAFKKNSLAAVTYVPFNQTSLIKKNSPCTVEIPGRRNVNAHFGKQLFTADNITQTQPYIVPLPSNLNLSGNMNLLVRFKEKEIHDGIFVPRKAVLTNEEENTFWLMKMTNDTTAIKIPVNIGWQGENLIQILSGNIQTTDKVITEGAYGLPDTAYVKIAK